MSSNVIHQAPSARRQASPSKRTTGNTSHSCFAVSLVAAAIALAACPAMAAGMVTAGSGAGVAVGATSSTTGANQVAVGPNARTDSTYSGNAGEASIAIGANAKTITEDLDARYEAFADAEAFLIENALVIPLGMPVPPYIATRLNLWEGQYAPTGLSTNRLKGVHILDHYVSMEEYNQNRDAR